MPESWVRGAILIRMNSLIRGHSGVRWELIEKMNELLSNNITPVVPLRGSISSSGGQCFFSECEILSGLISGLNRSIPVVLHRRHSCRKSFYPCIQWPIRVRRSSDCVLTQSLSRLQHWANPLEIEGASRYSQRNGLLRFGCVSCFEWRCSSRYSGTGVHGYGYWGTCWNSGLFRPVYSRGGQASSRSGMKADSIFYHSHLSY